jgi:hypothetical protein
MRVISQDGSIDVPYESSMFHVETHANIGDPVVFDIYVTIFGAKQPAYMARYYSPQKAEEAMNMLQNTYLGVTHQENVAKVFRFPQDDLHNYTFPPGYERN